ncbi:MAG: hypothetical protein JJT93_00420 [Gammaproteobacteria bacterium]|nr:hypothetical protein [Gammaproteobacteria bacterium]TVQ49285.1 MAG: hypothetical protein EA371_03160 [Gammaproteobacteria bacterium]
MFRANCSISWSEGVGVRRPCRTLFQALLATGLALAVAGCGFQLRGVIPLPPEMAATYIETPDRFSELHTSLREALRANGMRVVEDRREASAVVRLLQDETGERVLSVSARNIPREFEVFYIVEFELDVDGETRLRDQRIVQTRAYTWRETEVLGKAEEGRRIRRALADDLASRMLRRMSSAVEADG